MLLSLKQGLIFNFQKITHHLDLPSALNCFIREAGGLSERNVL
jgi:hypothetical protein